MRVLQSILLPFFLLAPAAVVAQDVPHGAPAPPEAVILTDKAISLHNNFRMRPDETDRNVQYQYGLRYETGNGVLIDLPQAAQWYRKAAMRGHVDAMLALGQMHQSGRGLEQDDAQAVDWYRRAAAEGSLPAQYNLALMLAHGAGVPQDYSKAADLYERAAQRGFAKAQYNLAVMLALGQAGEPDVEAAYKWFRIVGNDGNTLAQTNMARLAARMSADQLARAEQLARQWRPIKPD